jgi:hypothetical protein
MQPNKIYKTTLGIREEENTCLWRSNILLAKPGDSSILAGQP